jgi:hypothetical protein
VQRRRRREIGPLAAGGAGGSSVTVARWRVLPVARPNAICFSFLAVLSCRLGTVVAEATSVIFRHTRAGGRHTNDNKDAQTCSKARPAKMIKTMIGSRRLGLLRARRRRGGNYLIESGGQTNGAGRQARFRLRAGLGAVLVGGRSCESRPPRARGGHAAGSAQLAGAASQVADGPPSQGWCARTARHKQYKRRSWWRTAAAAARRAQDAAPRRKRRTDTRRDTDLALRLDAR